MKGSNSKPMPSVIGSNEEVDWELRPGGMLVQKREDGNGADGPMIKVKVSHDSYLHEVTVPIQSTFGELKRNLSQETGLRPEEQRLLFRGKEKDDDDFLHISGVKDLSKLVLLEDPASKERKLELMKKDQRISKACEAIAEVRTEVDKLIEKVNTLASAVHGRIKVADQEFVVLIELLMRQLLKLDSIEAEGDNKVHRRNEVRRIQQHVELLDALKARNSNPFINMSNAMSVATQGETSEPGVGSFTAPSPMLLTKITEDWERFE